MSKEFEPDDPMELVGVELPGGDIDQALDDLVLEYLSIGWSPTEIMFLFRSPHYQATHNIYRQKGHGYVKERIENLAGEWNRGWIAGGMSNA
ncbi:MAG: hypothetical protein FJ316_01405 [SAR202 cluster bacterium]|nr:hypothetical protein [SAR202 cluster bacterium]